MKLSHLVLSCAGMAVLTISCSNDIEPVQIKSTIPSSASKVESADASDITKSFEQEASQAMSIVGGAVVTDTNIQNSVVYIYFTNNLGKAQFCTGVLVSRRALLTAAHCLYGTDNKLLSVNNYIILKGNEIFNSAKPPVWLANNAQKGKNGVVGIASIKANPDYLTSTNKLRGDIGTIIFSSDIPSNVAVKPMNLLKNPSSPAGFSSSYIAAGYGFPSRTDLSKGDGVLRSVAGIKMLEYHSAQYYAGTKTIDLLWKNMKIKGNTAAGADVGASHGDSGGPLFYKTSTGVYYLVGTGVSLFGTAPNDDILYASASQYEAWLESATGGALGNILTSSTL